MATVFQKNIFSVERLRITIKFYGEHFLQKLYITLTLLRTSFSSLVCGEGF